MAQQRAQSRLVHENAYPGSKWFEKKGARGRSPLKLPLSRIDNLHRDLSGSDHVIPARVPFCNRNQKLHRSNPHLYFSGLSAASQGSSDSGFNPSNVKLFHHVNPPGKRTAGSGSGLQSRWKNDLSAVVNNLPRKWCDFVFRRNADNKLYRSESFRFIQKTSSLQMPQMSAAALNKQKGNKHQVPVSEDYVEPLDYVACFRPLDKPPPQFADRDDERAVDGIIAKYNAPYYYSETLKDPTYCSPCSTWRQSCGDLEASPERHTQSSHSHSQQPQPQLRLSGPTDPPMARKRYETAFLPSGNSPNPSPPAHASDDVDCLILAIESSCSAFRRPGADVQEASIRPQESAVNTHLATGNSNNNNNNSNNNNMMVSRSSSSSMRVSSAVPTSDACSSSSSSHSYWKVKGPSSQGSGSSTTSNSSPLNTKKCPPSTPLSEPLPQKRYSSTTSCSSSSPAGPSLALAEKRTLLSLMKESSVSSLESIESDAKSSMDELQSSSLSSSSFGRAACRLGRQPANWKLLSPISDKSPMEGNLETDLQGCSDQGHSSGQWPNYQQQLLISTAELTNVPWDMPKIKRRLALLADSGISLDLKSDSGRNSSTDADPPALGRASAGGGSTERDAFNSNCKGGSGNPMSERSGKSQPNLQLNLDGCGLVHDEYYEDPALSVRAPCTTVTSVQVHVSDPRPTRPDRCRMKLDFASRPSSLAKPCEIDPNIELEAQEWFHGAITRSEAEGILRATKEGSFLIRHCESSTFNRYSLSLKSARGYIHVRIEPNSLGTFSLGEQKFPTVPHLVLHFMNHRLPIKGAEHVKLIHPVITQLL